MDVALSVSVIKGTDGQIIGSIGVMADITERKRVEEIRERLTSELEEKNKEMEQIIYVTSHDFRSPLVNIKGFSMELERSIEDMTSILQNSELSSEVWDGLSPIVEEDIPEALQFIQSSIPKMETLLNGLLEVSRAGRTEPKFEELDMNGLLQEVKTPFEHVIREGGVQVKIGHLPSCMGDKGQINQVFSNLLGNALKYLDPSRPGIIQITSQKDTDKVIYCVEDNGIGIPDEHKEKVFQMFHRIDTEVTTGEGLGLTIIKKILGKHSGKIWLESEYGVGSKFFVSLPLTVGNEGTLDDRFCSL